MTSLPERLIAAAYHEAGHAVVGVRYGCLLERIQIDPDTLCGKADIAQLGRYSWRKDVIIALAGNAAYVTWDPERRFAYADQGFRVDQNDISRAESILGGFCQDDEFDGRIDRCRARWEALAMTLIKRSNIWRAVVAVSEAVERSGWYLNGPTATATIQAAMNEHS